MEMQVCEGKRYSQNPTYLNTAVAGPPDGHLPDSADQDSAATAREAHVRFGESAQGIPEAPPRVVPLRRERGH